MPRARFIRPEFFTDAKVCRLPVHARLLFERTWVNADLRGVFPWDVDQYKADTFPMDNDVCPAQVGHWLDLCLAQGLVVRFSAPDASGQGREWGWIPNFQKHQPITSSERKWGTKYPEPPARHVPGMSQTCAHTLTPALTLTPAQAPAQAPAPAHTAGSSDTGLFDAPQTKDIEVDPIQILTGVMWIHDFKGDKEKTEANKAEIREAAKLVGPRLFVEHARMAYAKAGGRKVGVRDVLDLIEAKAAEKKNNAILAIHEAAIKGGTRKFRNLLPEEMRA